MFHSFFLNRKWLSWAWLGALVLLAATWYKVELDVQINTWFGDFYDAIQTMLTKPGSVSLSQYLDLVANFAKIAAVYVLVGVVAEFFGRHYIFRWRTAMTEHYLKYWHQVRHIEGASQRIQEDTMRFARIMESLGESLLRSVMTLAAFLPILWKLSESITEMPWIGKVEHALVYLAILFALFGTVVMALVGIKLPGLEFNNQKVEAAYRKELVLGEESAERAQPPTVQELFSGVRKNYFRLYFHYLYFDLIRWSYIQFGVVVPYIALGPSLVMGLITLGVLQEIVRAFNRVESAFQFLVQSWPTIVELLSIYKRLKGFEEQIQIENTSA